jgi:hypothetical protein
VRRCAVLRWVTILEYRTGSKKTIEKPRNKHLTKGSYS